jgi:hypothetical protein
VAEACGFLSFVIASYPGAHGQSSARQEFLNAMMISVSSTDGLTPVQQEIAERVIAHFSALFKLEKVPSAACNYYFDLAASQPPARIIKDAAHSATLRYFGAGEALARLQQLAAEIRESGGVPQDVHLGGVYQNEVILGVLEHLAQYWSENLPERSAERRKTASRITIVPGFTEILSILDSGSSFKPDFKQDKTAESWIVENVSDDGYGAIIPVVKKDWVKVGELLLMRGETAIYWGIGLVRRVTTDEYQQRRIGIQMLSKTAIPVKISPAASDVAVSDERAPEPAILLSISPDSKGEVGVIMRAGLYNPRYSMDMTINGKPYLLMPAGMVENGEDFDWAKFKVMRRPG